MRDRLDLLRILRAASKLWDPLEIRSPWRCQTSANPNSWIGFSRPSAQVGGHHEFLTPLIRSTSRSRGASSGVRFASTSGTSPMAGVPRAARRSIESRSPESTHRWPHYPGHEVLLLGWHEELGVFAAFDPVLHRQPGYSPSVQIPIASLVQASNGGLARHIRGNGEIAMAFPPSTLGSYVEHQRHLHSRLEEPEEADPARRASIDSAEVLAAEQQWLDKCGGCCVATRRSPDSRYLFDARMRRAVELLAMDSAIRRCRRTKTGGRLRMSQQDAPYDLRCSKGDGW